MSDGYSSRLWQCPYFMGDKRQEIYCEGGRVAFADRPTYLRYAVAYCCRDWGRCTLARALNHYYGVDV